MNFLRDLSISLFTRGQIARHTMAKSVLANPGVVLVVLGMTLATLPLGAHAASLSEVFTNWATTARDFINFVMICAVVVGVMAIFYGCKLIVDKSNDRENVKNMHIIASFVGGAMLCVLWWVVTTLTDTTGDGNSGQIGSPVSF